ncbi:MAG: PIG-L family deacetylase [Gemmatimonadota bacterium]|nr:PIG-L family deacetylase [Gemmatimonadota bacterium]
MVHGRRIIRRTVAAVRYGTSFPLEYGWKGLLRGTRWHWGVRPRRQPDWQNERHVAIVAPHPDDETLGAGGAILLHRRSGAEVQVIVVTDGGGARPPGSDTAMYAAMRAAELRNAMAQLGVGLVTSLRYPERTGNQQDVRDRLAPLIDSAQIVYAPSCVDFHPDHLWVAQAVAAVIRPDQVVRAYELGVPLTPILANCVLDTAAVADAKRAALACFATQTMTMAPLHRGARYRSALYGHTHCEVFWELSGRAYRALMQTHAWGFEDTPFRGIRRHPLTDPWAFFLGTRARRRLRRASEMLLPQPVRGASDSP